MSLKGAVITAKTVCDLLEITQEGVDFIADKIQALEERYQIEFLASFSFLKVIPPEQLQGVNECLRVRQFGRSEVVYKE